MSDVVHVRDDTGVVHVLGDSSVVHVFDDTNIVSVREDADVVHVVLVRDDTNIVSVINFGAGGGTANVTFPLQGTSGSCLVPTYSFGLAPTSGLFHDPASPVLAGGGEAVVLSWDSCSSRIDVGESVRLTALNGDYIEIGAAVSVVAAVGNISLLGTTGVTASAVTGDVTLIATAGAITNTAATNFDVTTNAVQRLRINASGAWLISSDAGSAGEVLTSAGNAATPVWATPAPPSFPILASNGTCAAPAYSFTASPDSGVFYTGTAVRISDDNCTDYISVGASIELVTSASAITITSGAGIAATAVTTISLTATGNLTTSGANNFHTATSGNVALAASSQVTIATAATVRLAFSATGEWLIGGTAGTAGQLVTSNGAGTPPTWQTAPTSFPGYGSPVTTACANADGISVTTARADHVHRSEMRVQDEGSAVGARCSINFIGGGVVAVDNPGSDRVDVTISGAVSFPGYGSPATTACANADGGSSLAARADHVHRSEMRVQDEGVAVGARCSINFIGAGVAAVDNGGSDRIDVTIPGGGTPDFPVLAPSGTCAAPSYSFSASPDSGLLYTGTTVRLADDNCADYIELGEGVAIVSTAGTLSISNLNTQTSWGSGGGIDATASGAISFDAGDAFIVMTGGIERLNITTDGDWQLASDPGAAGDVLTSNGPALPPTWQPPASTLSFPLAAPNGTCAAPSYSFTAAPTSGMLYTGTAVRVSDSTCADYVEVGVGIAIVSTANGIALNAFTDITLTAVDTIAIVSTANDVIVSGEGLTLEATTLGVVIQTVGGTVELSATGEILLNGLPGTAGDVLTSNGVGAMPTWQTPGASVTYPLLAPDGTCGAPSYSFTNSPDSGVLYTGTAVRVADDNCADYVEIGTGVAIFSTAGAVAITTNNVLRITYETDGSWNIGGSNGTAGDVLTSAGAAAPPVWAAPTSSSLVLYDENPVAHVAPNASGTNAFVIGSGAAASATDSFAFGTGAQATATEAIAIGETAVAAGAQSIAIGSDAITNAAAVATVTIGDNASTNDAAALRAIAIGSASSAIALESICIGATAATHASAMNSIAIGSAASTNNIAAINAIAIGNAATAIGLDAVAVGENARARALGSVAVGSDALADTSASDAVAIGNGANASTVNAVAVGELTVASGTGAIAVGGGAQGTGGFSMALGQGAIASNTEAIAIGESATAAAAQSICIGSDAITHANASASVTIGDNASTNNTAALNAIAIGAAATATGAESIALGEGAIAAGSTVICIGSDAIGNSAAQETISIGNNASTNNASALAAIAIGRATTALATESVSIGDGATNGTGSAGGVAIGNGAATNTARSIAIGNAASAPAQESICIGDAAVTNSACTGTIAIGNGATTSNAAALRSIAIGNAASAIALESISIGDTAITNAACTGSIQIGDAASTSNAAALRSIAIGAAATATALEAVALGEGAQALATTSIAIGSDAVVNASAANAIAIGDNASCNNAAALRAVALGVGCSAVALESICIGDTAVTNSSCTGSIAIGDAATISTTAALRAISIGASSQATEADGVALGEGAQCHGAQGVAIGSDAVAGSAATASIAIGDNAFTGTLATSAIVIGHSASTTGASVDSIVIGHSASVTAVTVGAIVIGETALNGGATDAINIGSDSTNTATADESVAIGNNSGNAGVSAVSIGSGASTDITGGNGVAIGALALVSHAGSVALGAGANSSADDQITLGASTLVEVVPGADITQTLGSSARRWKSLYLQSIIAAPTNKTVAATPYAVLVSDFAIFVDSSGGAVEVDLPASPTNGRIVIIKKVSTDANNVTIDGNGKTLDGAATIVTAATNRPSLMFLYDSSANDWRIV